ncbi:uncharacterized protein LOC126779175 isoform X2 [Nymphalis io]|uniref:uncharacterized protein LOC126779175 isoform X2 n=1 Tax=Inachis io TaxID=171585 RepID=UPI0021688FE2|nr:uncharacterized protein LOC126779175 isoform X2 [Nymphalis io]
MMRIILIIFVFKCVSGDDDSYEKFIDSLPEDEKREFLDRIARRILEDINTDNVPDKSQVEIPDDQLEVHDAYVKDILKEETDRLKDEKKTEDSVRIEEPSDDGDNGDDQDDLIQTSLNKNLRKIFQNDNVLETISSNDAKFDNNSLEKEDYNINSETITPSSKEQMVNTTSEDIKIDELSANEKGDLDEDVRTDVPTIVVNNISTTVSTIHTTTTTNNRTNDLDTTTVHQMKPENTSEIINHPFQRKGGLNINKNVSSTVDTNTTDINDLEIDSLIQLTPSPIDILKVNNSEDGTKFVEIKNEDENHATNSISNATAVRKNVDIKSVDIVNEKDDSNDNKEPKASLRSVSDDLESEEDNKVLIKTVHSKPGLEKEYEVYEVAAEKPPFTLQNNIKINEQPRYVPIYDYAPEKAYFRPYDRFGPNFEEAEPEYLQNYNIFENIEEDNMNTINIPNKRSRFGSYKKINQGEFKIQNNNYPNNKDTSKMYGFMKPVHFANQKMYYNPYDYLDIEYNNRYNDRSFLRQGSYRSKYKPFPNSNELDHPYNAIHKSKTLKDHVRAIRNILYLQEVFGYVPDIETENRKFDQETKKKKENVLKNHPEEDIGIDYYYDRVSSKEESENPVRGNISKVKKLQNKDVIRNLPPGLNISNQKQTLGLSSDEFLNKLNDIIADDKKFSSFFDAMLNVTADNIRFNNEALEHYDWLKTSVNIQSAVRKLLTLAESLQNGEDVHPKDLELLKYSIYQFKSSQMMLRDGLRGLSRNVKMRKQKKGILPKNNRNRNRIKQPLKLWKDFAKYLRIVNYDGSEQKLTLLYDFEDFLQNLLFYLNEFHDAVKHVAMVTRFRDQKWFNDLKQIFFRNATKKQLGQVVLHLCLANLLDRVEEDAINGSDDNFREFVENNSEAVKSTKKEFVFVLRILNELNRLYA